MENKAFNQQETKKRLKAEIKDLQIVKKKTDSKVKDLSQKEDINKNIKTNGSEKPRRQVKEPNISAKSPQPSQAKEPKVYSHVWKFRKCDLCDQKLNLKPNSVDHMLRSNDLSCNHLAVHFPITKGTLCHQN